MGQSLIESQATKKRGTFNDKKFSLRAFQGFIVQFLFYKENNKKDNFLLVNIILLS